MYRQQISWLAKLVLGLSLLLALSERGRAESGPQLVLNKSVSPSSVAAGGRVTYIITLSNTGNEPVEGITIRDTLPNGFTYLSGSSRITVNGVTVSTMDPTISGRTLTWTLPSPPIRLPSGRSNSFYGIHTFVQSRWNPCDHGYIDYQLDRARELMGAGSYVTQLCDWIGSSWQGPLDCWKYFVTKAYDRGLTPVVRLAGACTPQYWIKPEPDPDGSYRSWARALAKVVEGLPKRDGYYLYVQIWNEPNLNYEWEGQANPQEYGRFLVDAANAIRALGDPHVVILNAPLAPGGNYYYLDYLRAMLTSVPASLWAFDIWASHPYPGNRPPSYNIHDSTARDNWAAIDLYQRELEILAQYGRSGVKVLLTETGYELGNCYDVLYPSINESNRADYILRAFRDYWSKWPEVIGVCPYELLDPQGKSQGWDWIGHQQYDAVRAMDKSYTAVGSIMRITFQVTAASSAGTYYNDVSVIATNAPALSLTRVAPVTVYVPTPTRTPTATQTRTPIASPTSTATATATWTPTPTFTTVVTASPTPISSATFVSTETPPITPEATDTLSVTPTAMPRPTETPTPTETYALSPTPSVTMPQPPTITPTYMHTPLPTATCTATSLPTMTVSPTLPSPTVTPSPISICRDLIINGGFELDGIGWEILPTAYLAVYTTAQAYSGYYAIRLGIESPSDNIRSYSTIRQIVQIPADASNPILSFWYYPVSGDTANDLQYVRVVAGGKAEWVLRECSNAQSWLYKSYPLDDFKGYEVSIYFTVVNDGAGGVTAMYVDDVSLWTCGTQSVLSNRVFLPILLRTAEESPPLNGYPEMVVATLGSSAVFQPSEIGSTNLQMQEGVNEALAWGSNIRVLWQTDESSGPDVIQGIVLNPANNLLYVGMGKAIWVMEARSGEVVARIPLPAIPYGLAVDATHNRVYAALQEMDALAVIDNAQQRLLAIVPGIPGASGVALGGGYIYVTAARSDELVVVNGQNCAIMKRVPVGATPYAVLYDLGLQRVYVGNAGDDTVSVIDGRDWTLVSLVKLGGLGHPHGLALDPIREHLYVTYALSPKHRAIAVVDTLSGRVISSLQGSENETLSGAYGVAVDPLRGEVYVTTADKLLVLADEPLRIVQSIVGIGPAYAFGVAAAPLERRVYLADGRHNRLVVIQ